MKFTPFILLLSLVLGFNSNLHAQDAHSPKNIILLIGDGMGYSATTAYRYYQSSGSRTVSETFFDQLLVGSSMNYPADSTLITDSAAAATALATGRKSYNGAISVDQQRKPLTSLFSLAKSKGYQTGVVVTSAINHATPAAFYANNEDRHNDNAIADDFVDHKVNGKPLVDLAFGGGLKYFQRTDRDLTAELQQLNFSVTTDVMQLYDIGRLPAVALLADDALPYAIDAGSDQKNRLSQMTHKALELLSYSEKPFVLVIEASLIDWCAHENDIACLLAEMSDFEQTLELSLLFAQHNKETLVLATADHATGGLSVGGYDQKKWLPQQIAKIHSSIYLLAQKLDDAPIEQLQTCWNKAIEFPLAAETLASLTEIKQTELDTKSRQSLIRAELRAVLNHATFTGWSTLNHTADDVPVYAFGPGSERFHGQQDNAGIGQKLQKLLR